MRKLVIVLVVLVLALIAVDRIAAAVAESRISSRVAASYQLPVRPHVTIKGFPFLTQVLAGDYREIDVSVSRVAVGSIHLTGLTARLNGVRAPVSQLLRSDMSTITADHAVGSAVIPYTELARWLPSGLQLSQDGSAVRVSGSVQVLGVRVPLSGTAVTSVTSGGIKVTPKHVTVAPGVAVPVSAITQRIGAIVIPLTDLPLHLQVASVAATGTGLLADATARNVHFTGGS
jgi:LmeA-like phospholipid-binding